MITGLLIVALQAAPVPSGDTLHTVGDTLWIERALGVVNGVVRPQPWELGRVGQQLGPAQVQITGKGTIVRYPIVLWYPGDHTLTMPGPVVVRRDGRSDTLPGSPVHLVVHSVLPSDTLARILPPAPARVAIKLGARALLPLVMLVGAVLLLAALMALRWRRQGRPLPAKKPARAGPSPALLEQWAAAGEYRAALNEWAWILADRLKMSNDLEETGRLQKLIDEISYGSFSERNPVQLAALCERAAQLGQA